jgi:hypothetical protein
VTEKRAQFVAETKDIPLLNRGDQARGTTSEVPIRNNRKTPRHLTPDIRQRAATNSKATGGMSGGFALNPIKASFRNPIKASSRPDLESHGTFIPNNSLSAAEYK